MSAVPGSEPSAWSLVLASIDQLRKDMSAQYAALNARLDKVVTQDVHAADLRRVEDRLADTAADIGVERAARAEAVAEQGQRIEHLREALEQEARNRREADREETKALEQKVEAQAQRIADHARRRKQELIAIVGLGVTFLGVMVAGLAILAS